MMVAGARERLATISGHLAPPACLAAAAVAADPDVPSTHSKLYITAPREVAWLEETTPACPDDGVLVKTATTCMSIGTELRCYRGIPVDPVDIGGEGKYLHVRGSATLLFCCWLPASAASQSEAAVAD